MKTLTLASRSPRRSAMLHEAGFSFATQPADCEEVWLERESPIDFARRIAQTKSMTIAESTDPKSIVLGADTVVWIDGHQAPLGKPKDREDAARMLAAISGPSGHCVTTAFALVHGRVSGPQALDVRIEHQTTRVFMRPMSGPRLDRYLDSMEWTDKAGAYGIQGRAAQFVHRIEGSYTNVVGLPLAAVIIALGKFGIVPASPVTTGGSARA